MERLHKLGHGLVPWSRTANPGLVQHQHKEVNALTVDNAGTAQFQTSPMQNTKIHKLAKKFPNKTYRELELEIQASSTKRQTKKAYKPVDINKYRNVSLSKDTYAKLVKLQAPSSKRQASSSKQQAIYETVPHCDIEEARASSPKDGHKNFFWPTIPTRRKACDNMSH